jgi:hypothetical protein
MWGRMNALARLASLLGLENDEVNDLTKAILAAENRQLPARRASPAAIALMRLSRHRIRNAIGISPG